MPLGTRRYSRKKQPNAHPAVRDAETPYREGDEPAPLSDDDSSDGMWE